MAQSGYTPILLYGSGTAGNTPTSTSLSSLSTGAELAINYADGKLFYKDNTNTIQVIASKAAASGSFPALTATNLTVTGTTTISGTGTINGVSVGASSASTGAFTTVSATGQITSTVANGTAPFSVLSSTQIPSLNANFAGSIIGGTANQILAQSGVNATGFITAPTLSSTFLQWTGSTFTWTAAAAGNFMQWQAIQAANFTAALNSAYIVNTTSTAITVNLPTGAAIGNMVLFTDYAGTWATRAVTVAPGASKINGSSSNYILNVNRTAIGFVYADATQGWVAFSTSYPTVFSQYAIGYLLLGGGGGGGGNGGGGAGGLITNGTSFVNPGISYTIVVGGGGTAGGLSGRGGNGGDSTAFSSTAIGGGGGNANPTTGGDGGSGGAWGGSAGNGGAGTPGQGFRGGNTGATYSGSAGAGGGGAGAAGTDCGSTTPTPGGGGVTWSQNGVTYAGGGGGGSFNRGGAVGGSGGGGTGSSTGGSGNGSAGSNGFGGGGGGGYISPAGTSGYAGGSGVCIVYYAGAQRGTGGAVTSAGGYTYHTFTSSGTYVG
jgi:hypothetical protein